MTYPNSPDDLAARAMAIGPMDEQMTDKQLNLLLRASLALTAGMQVAPQYHLARGGIRWVGDRYGICQMVPETRYRVVERTGPETYKILGDWHSDAVWLAIWRAEDLERQSLAKAKTALGDLGYA
ncbi:MAG: hypothetical protein ACRD3M_18710 [Thermoanaerobaculia bacterium]